MLKKDELINWCWENLEFNNCPDDWTDTYIVDILNGYNNTCHTKSGKSLSYAKIRSMFCECSDDEE